MINLLYFLVEVIWGEMHLGTSFIILISPGFDEMYIIRVVTDLQLSSPRLPGEVALSQAS